MITELSSCTDAIFPRVRPESRWIAWAALLDHVFAIEQSACVCGGRCRGMAVLKDERVAWRISPHTYAR